MKLECFSRVNRQSRDRREEGEQLHDAVTVFPHVLRMLWRLGVCLILLDFLEFLLPLHEALP